MKPIKSLTVKHNPQTHGCTCGRFNTSIFDSLLWNRTFHNKQSASSAYCKEELQYTHPQMACQCTFPVFPLCTLFLPESSAWTASPNLKFLKRSSDSLSSTSIYHFTWLKAYYLHAGKMFQIKKYFYVIPLISFLFFETTVVANKKKKKPLSHFNVSLQQMLLNVHSSIIHVSHNCSKSNGPVWCTVYSGIFRYIQVGSSFSNF